MARKPRKYGETGIYHVILRGNDQGNLFYNDNDKIFFIKRLQKYIIETNVELYSYCLMENHIHLLIGKANDLMPLLIQKLTCSYVYYFNHKYDRTGHLFQGRYKSEPVETAEYFKTVYRYILQNPEKAGICTFTKYKWNSLHHKDLQPSFINQQFVQEVFGTSKEMHIFLAQQNSDHCMDTFDIKEDFDNLSILFINHLFKIKTPMELSRLPLNLQKDKISLLKKCGLPINRISRLTKINKRVISEA